MLYNRNTLIFNNACFQRSVIFIIGVSVYTLSHSDVQKLIFADSSSVRGKSLPAAATGALVAGRSNTRQHHAHSHMTALKTRLAQRKKEETRRRERRTGGTTPPAVMGAHWPGRQPWNRLPHWTTTTIHTCSRLPLFVCFYLSFQTLHFCGFCKVPRVRTPYGKT